MDKNTIKKLLKIIFVDFLIYGFLYFPIWWYSFGLYKTMLKCQKIMSSSYYSLGIAIQFRYLFAPMYAQRDFTGLAISFVMRIVMLIYKIIVFFFVFIFCIILFILWVFLPIIVLYGIFSNYKFLIQK